MTEMKASLNEWNNQEEKGGKRYGGIPGIQPSITIEDSYFNENV